MSEILRIVVLVCFLIVPSKALLTEDDPDFFPPEFICFDSGFNLAAQLYWISEAWKRNAPYEIGYPLLYSILIVLPLIPFLCFLISSKQTQQCENDQKERQKALLSETETESESENDDDEEEIYVLAENPYTMTPCKSLALSDSDSSIGERLVTAVELTKLESCAPRVTIETPLIDEREEGEVAVAEQFPDLTTVDTTDSFTRIKELAEGICPESTLGKTCVMIAAGALISYGIYRLLSK